MKIPSGVWVIIGSLVTAGAVLVGQINESRQSSVRHLQGLAYQAAVEEWKYHIEQNKKFREEAVAIIGKIEDTKLRNEKLKQFDTVELFEPSLTDLIFYHITLSYALLATGAEQVGKDEAAVFIRSRKRDLKLRNIRSSQSADRVVSGQNVKTSETPVDNN